MQDSLKSSMSLSNVSVQITGSRKQIKKFANAEVPYEVKSEAKHGSSITIACVPSKSQKSEYNLTIKGNPIGFLTGQNVWGTCNMPQLNLALFTKLSEMGILEFTTEQYNRIAAGDYNINEVAFAQYVQTDGTYLNKLQLMGYVKRLYACAMSPHWNINVHMYAGCGLIVRKRDQTLCIYDKLAELTEKETTFDDKLVGDLTEVSDKLRFETTLKYNWLQSHNRLTVSKWAVDDWSTEARNLVLQACDNFKLSYLLTCPNIFADSWQRALSSKDVPKFVAWTKTPEFKPDRETIRRFMNKYGLDMELSYEAHKHLLYARLEPYADIEQLLSENPVKVSRALRGLEYGAKQLRTSDSLAQRLLPLDKRIKGSGPRRQLELINAKAGLVERRHQKERRA